MNHALPARAKDRAGDPTAADRSDVEAYYRDVAPYYDAELADRDDLGFWQQIGAAHRGGTVLELGAGTGRVTEELARFARHLVAIDLSPELLRVAQARLSRLPQARLVRADMRTLAFRRPFDLIVAANDPFSHLGDAVDRDRALDGVARHLATGGHFVLDALWLAPGEASAIASRGGRVRRHTTTLDGKRLRVVERWQRSAGEERCCHARYEYRCSDRPPVIAEFDARDWSPSELCSRFRRAGLVVTKLWGSHRQDVWDPRRSTQLIVEATRN